jgi:hypothetical protein
MLEPSKACLKANQASRFAREHKAQLGHIVVNQTAWLVNFRQQFHFLVHKATHNISTLMVIMQLKQKEAKQVDGWFTYFTNNLHCILYFFSMSSD